MSLSLNRLVGELKSVEQDPIKLSEVVRRYEPIVRACEDHSLLAFLLHRIMRWCSKLAFFKAYEVIAPVVRPYNPEIRNIRRPHQASLVQVLFAPEDTHDDEPWDYVTETGYIEFLLKNGHDMNAFDTIHSVLNEKETGDDDDSDDEHYTIHAPVFWSILMSDLSATDALGELEIMFDPKWGTKAASLVVTHSSAWGVTESNFLHHCIQNGFFGDEDDAENRNLCQQIVRRIILSSTSRYATNMRPKVAWKQFFGNPSYVLDLVHGYLKVSKNITQNFDESRKRLEMMSQSNNPTGYELAKVTYNTLRQQYKERLNEAVIVADLVSSIARHVGTDVTTRIAFEAYRRMVQPDDKNIGDTWLVRRKMNTGHSDPYLVKALEHLRKQFKSFNSVNSWELDDLIHAYIRMAESKHKTGAHFAADTQAMSTVPPSLSPVLISVAGTILGLTLRVMFPN